jgi:DedD protein
LDEKLKQRLVGASVLVALAVIFLPSLFHKDQRVSINTTTQIPPAPVVEPVVIPKPVRPEGVTPPTPDKLFQPEVLEEPAVAEQKEPVKQVDELPKKVPEKPRLTESGVPAGWVVQAASFKSKESADKFTARLLKADYKAYQQGVKTNKGEFFRVFIGPYINQKDAVNTQKKVDKDYKVKSRVQRFNPISGN